MRECIITATRLGLPSDVYFTCSRPASAEGTMKTYNLKRMSIDELWIVHEQICSVLVKKIAEKEAGFSNVWMSLVAASAAS